MQLENRFTIEAPVDVAWAALNNPETVAPCFPGATLTEYDGASFVGTVKVKLGPISLTYKGKGTYGERDDAARRVVITATGRDVRGNGTANAKVVGSVVPDGPDKTEVTMVTDLTITGRPAQFGRGVISDVADKIIGQFASCLADKLTGPAGAEAAAPAPEGGPVTGGAAAQPAVPPGPPTAPTAPAPVSTAPAAGVAPAAQGRVVPREPLRSEVESIDLLEAAGVPVLKRVLPILAVFAALTAVFVILWRLRRGAAEGD